MITNDAPNDEQQTNTTDKVANAEGPKVVHKLPRSIRLGIEHVVKVKLVTPATIKAVSPGGHELDGMWDDVNKLIYVDKTLSLEDQWETLRHELLHAIIDIDHEVRITEP